MAALAQSAAVAAISSAPVASGAVATSSSKAQSNSFAFNGLKSASTSLQVAQPSEWSSKTVSNSTRVELHDSFSVPEHLQLLRVWNPYNNKKFETLSYLPPLSDTEIAKQIQYLINNGWIPTIEFDQAGDITRTNGSWPTYYDGRYWTMWKLPMFGCNDPSQVLAEIQQCKTEYPNVYIRVIGFDNVRQVQCASFIVHKP
ncbi:hypothetical protein CBR_g46359 [Chara braunii]|uniref:Ribulose bisphosphate carboxylase small subunit, chloroplastic n=1 Tax=Chara braunii TaxID=69332 RepID=A0A388M098_CHABU|nr:hypothetical protein CBR_g46359 [Chara braunii]|eukprot:GBG87988.1 hypothetical protein CBR_g46359 [Chara braunii]